MSLPTQPGTYLLTDRSGDGPKAVDVVLYDGVLMAKLPDDDEYELHPVEHLDGEWSSP